MPTYIIINTDDVPADGTSKNVTLYKGVHADEDTAVEFCAALFGKTTDDWLWAVAGGNFTRYVCTESHTWTAAPG